MLANLRVLAALRGTGLDEGSSLARINEALRRHRRAVTTVPDSAVSDA
ncbi:hypothetical protein [Amycolatopsis alba]|nr:hypothetical protein [Amycolatopsis alba]